MTEHALIVCREPGRHSSLDKSHEEGGSAYANAGSSLRSPPGYTRVYVCTQHPPTTDPRALSMYSRSSNLTPDLGQLSSLEL